MGEALAVDVVSGPDFPEDLSGYNLIIHCGACMFNRRYVLSRIERARAAGVRSPTTGSRSPSSAASSTRSATAESQPCSILQKAAEGGLFLHGYLHFSPPQPVNLGGFCKTFLEKMQMGPNPLDFTALIA